MTKVASLQLVILSVAVLALIPASSACAEQVFAYCRTSVTASDIQYLSQVYVFTSKGHSEDQLRQGHDAYSFDLFARAHFAVDGNAGTCTLYPSRSNAADALNGAVSYYKKYHITFLETNWTPGD